MSAERWSTSAGTGAAVAIASNHASVGYLLNERISDIDEFVAHCRTVAAGGSVFDPLVTEQLIKSGTRPVDAR